MHIHLYISEVAPGRDRLRRTLQDSVPALAVIQYNSIEAIGCVIPMPTVYGGLDVAIVMVSDSGELTALSKMMWFWERVKTILILPDNEPETIKTAHALRPCYIKFMDGHFNDVATVVEHIYNTRNQKKT